MDETAYNSSGGSWRQWMTPRNIVIAVIAVFLVVVGAAGWRVYSNRHAFNGNVDAALKASDAAFAAGDYSGALSALQGAQSQTHNKAQLVQVYQQLAQSAASVGKVKDALHYYDLKHQADPNTVNQDAYIMGQLYEQEGNNSKALQLYQTALTYYKSLPNADQLWSQTSEIQGKIDAIKGQ